jgi:hypothetical protein
MILASFFKIYPYYDRLVLFLLPIYIVLFCSIITILPQNKYSKIFIYILVCIFIAFCINRNIEKYIVHNSGIREIYAVSQQYNKENKQMITSLQCCTKLCYSKGLGKDNLTYGEIIKDKKLPKGDYYIYETFYWDKNADKYSELKNLVQQSDILYLYKSKNNPNSYFAHIRIEE